MNKLLAFLVIPGLLLVSPALGQAPTCGPSVAAEKALTEKHKEAVVAQGIQSNGTMVEVWANKDRSTWTILVKTAYGVSCIVAAGSSWEDIEFVEMTGQPS